MEDKAMLKANDCAVVVDQEHGKYGNLLRTLPIKDADGKKDKQYQIVVVDLNGIVRLLHGPFTDASGGIWWYVEAQTDPGKPSDKGKKGWMAEVDPQKPAFVNLAPAKCA